MKTDTYDVAVIGAGASGSALLYVLSRYTALRRIALVERYAEPGTVNSHATNNSQTLHTGEIETNYSAEKVREVHPAALMVKRYTDGLPADERDRIIRRMQKMVLGVGSREVAQLKQRFADLEKEFRGLKLFGPKEIASVEPLVMKGRDPREPVAALFTEEGFAVDFGRLARSFIGKAVQSPGKTVDVFYERPVRGVSREDGRYILQTPRGPVSARAVVVDADAHSLGFAKLLGYGEYFSLIPIAGTFYFSPEKLKGKVYRVQDPKMPFSKVHGDPDLTRDGVTRWGPTARVYPSLEARRSWTILGYFNVSGLFRFATWMSFFSILSDWTRLSYLLKNFIYDLPGIGVWFLLPQLKRIVPTLSVSELSRAWGYGGMRLQRVDVRTRELLLGEGKIIGDNIIFNMTPSPGASVCLHNALRDAEQLMAFDPSLAFDKDRMLRDLCESSVAKGGDVSLSETYAA